MELKSFIDFSSVSVNCSPFQRHFEYFAANLSNLAFLFIETEIVYKKELVNFFYKELVKLN